MTPEAPVTEAGRREPEKCSWCTRPSNQGHRPNCPRPNEVFTATDMHNARVEAVARDREALAAKVRALIEEAGGLCAVPDDPEDPICETHSELLFDGFCEDDPRHLRAVLALAATPSPAPTDDMGSGSLDERDELRRLAEAATPGPWVDHDAHGPWVSTGRYPDYGTFVCDTEFGETGRARLDGSADAAYIAAASPDVVLRLLDRIEAAERVLDDLVEAIAELDWENAGLSDEQAAAWHHARDFLDSGPAAPSKESSDA